MELVLLQVGHRKEAAAVAHMHPVRVALVEQPLLQHHTGIQILRNIYLPLQPPQVEPVTGLNWALVLLSPANYVKS